MRAPRLWSGRFAEWNHANDFSGDEVKFRNHGCIPERHIATFAVFGHDRGVRKRAGNLVKSGKIESMDYATVRSVQENGFVGMVTGNEDTLFTGADSETQPRGVDDVLQFIATCF